VLLPYQVKGQESGGERELRLRAFAHLADVHTIGQWRVFEEMFEADNLKHFIFTGSMDGRVGASTRGIRTHTFRPGLLSASLMRSRG
jgi:hypothetical protein